MGNKSKTNGKKQSAKWTQRRDMAKARQPKKWTQWGGMAPASPSGGKALPVIHDSAKYGTLRRVTPLNSQLGRWS